MSATLAALLFDAPGPPGEVVVHCGEREVTRAQLTGLASALVDALHGAGVGAGATVATVLPSGPEAVAAMFGVWRAGCVLAPVNARLTANEVDTALAAAGAVAVVTLDGAGAWSVRAVPGAVSVPRDPDTALVLTTSGTTGAPKAVLLQHGAVLDGIDTVLGSLRGGGRGSASTSSESRAPMPNLVPVPLALWAGVYQVLFAFRAGAPVVLMDRFDTGEFAAAVRRFGLRSTVLAPAMLVMLTDDPEVTDLAPLRYVRSISSPLSPHAARRFHEKFGVTVLNSYGQTELGGEVVGWTAADAREFGATKLGALGRAHADVSVRVLGAEGSEAPAGEAGELAIRSPYLSGGYAAGDASLADRLVDGHLRTGDVGRVDADGFVWIEGRVSDAINRGGMKVFPADVEEVLRADPAVADVCVAGVPDARLGEVPWAWVVPAAGATVDRDALLARCRTDLAGYKVPARVEVIGALPRNDVGKVLRRVLVEGVAS